MKKFIQRLANTCGYRISRIVPVPVALGSVAAVPAPVAPPPVAPPPVPDPADPFAAMRQLLLNTERPIIFDVGAYHGHVSKHFRELFPSAAIYAFEPFPDSFERLRATVRDDPNTRAFNFGFSDRAGAHTFHSNPSAATNSLLATDAAGGATWGDGLLETQAVIEARFETVDAVVAEYQIPRIDLLKLDVQGAEPLVLAGAAATCRRKRIGLVYTEIILQPTYTGQKRFDEVLAAFYDAGFDLYDIYNMSHTRGGRLRQVDAIFTLRPVPDPR